MVLHAGSLGTQIEASVGAQEPAFIAKYAFQLAQAFNLFITITASSPKRTKPRKRSSFS